MNGSEIKSKFFSRRNFLELSAIGGAGLLIGCRNTNQSVEQKNSNIETNTTPAITHPQSSHVIVSPDQLVWKPLIPGVEVAVVFGDLDKKGGLFVIRIRSKGESKVPPHWHVTDEHVTVLEGSFWIAPGEQFDVSQLKELKAGAHFAMPAGHRHFGLHNAGNVIEVFGETPWVVNFVNPEDDPGRAKT